MSCKTYDPLWRNSRLNTDCGGFQTLSMQVHTAKTTTTKTINTTTIQFNILLGPYQK